MRSPVSRPRSRKPATRPSEADYAQTFWRIVDERLYPVEAALPKLTPASLTAGLPPGVSEIAYTLDLGGYTGASFHRAGVRCCAFEVMA
jgi:predicted MarR family transcription regulator